MESMTHHILVLLGKNTQELATWFYDNKDTIKDITDGALYYHADYIPDPRWFRIRENTKNSTDRYTHLLRKKRFYVLI